MSRNSDSDRTATGESNQSGIDADRRTFMKTVGVAVGTGLVGMGTQSAAAKAVDELTARGDATHIATASGTWDDAGIWNTGTTPGDGARVWIDGGVTVTLTHQDSARLEWVTVDGTLRFEPNVNTALNVDSLITRESSTFEMGTASNPVGPNRTAEITFIDRGPIDEAWDPERKSRGLLAMGDVTIHGAAKTAHTALAQHPTTGDGQIELSSAPTNWSAGDSLVIPGVSPHENQDEEVTVASVSGSTVSLQETLQYDHVPPAGDLDAYVLNLDRSVRLRSESTAIKRRGHVMFMQSGADVNYVGLYELGRTDKATTFTDELYEGTGDNRPDNANKNARYSLHLHKTGPTRDKEPHQITGCVVAPRTDGSGWKGSPGWGYTNHQSYGHFENCISYKVFGSGFQTETGVETGSFRNNFALRSAGSGEDPDNREFIEDFQPEEQIDDYGHGGHGFWMHGPLVVVEDNVAAGHRSFAYAYWNRALGDYVPEPVRGPDNQVRDPSTPSVPPNEFDRDVTEADVGRHRGTIPNVPAEYGDTFPTPANNVAPGSSGPQVDDFAHVSYTGDDGRTYVDEGSIPLRFVNNTAFASGSGIDIMNHMRGTDDTIEPNTEIYGLVEDFTAYAIGRRDGENSLPTTDINQDGEITFQLPRGTNIGIGMRYADRIRIENPRLIGTGSGVGITHNMRVKGMVVNDATIENFDSGIGALTDGLMEIRNPTFADITDAEINIRGEDILAGEPDTKMWGVDSGDEIYMNATNDVNTDWERSYSLDGRQVYFQSVAPGSAVSDPRLSGGLIEPGSGGEDDGGTGTATSINAGGDAVTVDGIDYSADAHFAGGTEASTTDTISGGADALYSSNRFGGSLICDVPVDSGSYDVTLHFAETYWTSAGSRVFDVAVEGSTVASGLDLYATAGHDVAHTESITGVSPSGGTITVDLTASADNALLSGVEITPAGGGSGGSGSVEAAINCGDSSGHTTSEGVTYVADTNYTGGAADAADRSIANTDEDGLFDSNRWGNDVVYDVPVSDSGATYDVTLHFSETYFSSSGARVFDVLVQGSTELAGFDPYAAAGGQNTAVSRTVSGVTPTDGTVSVSFAGQVDNALISGIEVVKR